ncbi:MAG: hypothetical protein U0804_26010 [Gemmataceae bacterium]
MLGLVLTAAIAPAAPPVDPDPKHLVVPPAEQARAAALVEKLGSPRFDDREKAQEELSAMGRRALPALADGLTKHASAEVRARCQALYPRARADDVQARLAVFVADEAGKFEHDLPGWGEFLQVTAGCGPAARAVFAEIVSNPVGRELVMTDLAPHDLGARIAARKQEIYQRRLTGTRTGQVPEPPVVELLALMLAESRIPSKHIPRTTSSVIVFTMPGFATAVNGGGREARVYRTIAGKWVASRDDATVMMQALSVGTALDLPEVADLGARMLQTAGVTSLNKAQAAMHVAKSGNPKFLPALEATFKDESVVRSVGVVVAAPIGAPVPPQAAAKAVQLRDIALASAVLLTEQDPTEYGYELSNNPPRTARYNYSLWTLPADRRAAAFAKWTTWRAANPDFGQLR